MELALKTEFENQIVEFLKDDNGEIIMDMEQLRKAVGYNSLRALKLMIKEHPELIEDEYSYKIRMENIEGGVKKMRLKRVFTEQGIYEVTFLANTQKARAFRRFAGGVLKALRTGDLAVDIQPLTTENRLDLLVEKITEREELMDQLANDSEKIVNLLIELKGKIETLDTMDQRLKEVEKTQSKLALIMQDLLRVMGEDDGEDVG